MVDDGNGKGKACPNGDVISMGPDLGGARPCIRHRPDHTVSVGFIHPVPEGETPGEVIQLRKRGDSNDYDVERVATSGRSGPARVNTDTYRKNYDTIFGVKTPVGEA